MKLINRSQIIFFILISLAYFYISSYQIKFPGFQEDEAMAGDHGLRISRLEEFPSMLTRREGAIGAYLLAPFFYLFSNPVLSVRIGSIFYSFLTLIFFFYICRLFFKNDLVASLITYFLAFHPAFILNARIGSMSGIYICLIEMIVIFFLARWYKTKKGYNLVIFFFMMGLGLGTLIHFLWFINALIGVYMIFKIASRLFIVDKRKHYPVHYIIYFLSFSLGAYNLLWYNLINKLDTINDLATDFTSSPNSIYNFADYIRNFQLVFNNFREILNGRFNFWFMSIGIERYFPNFYLVNLNATLFFLAFSWLSFSIFLKRKESAFIKKLFLLLMFVFIFIQTPFTPRDIATPQLLILLPFVYFIIGMGMVDSINFNKRLMKRIASAVILIAISANLWVINKYYRGLNEKGSGGYFSDSIYDLCNWLISNRRYQPVGLSNLNHSINLLSQRELKSINLHFMFYTTKKGDILYQKSCELLHDEKNIFIASMIDLNDKKSPCNLFIKYAELCDRKLFEVKRFYEKDGDCAYILFAVNL